MKNLLALVLVMGVAFSLPLLAAETSKAPASLGAKGSVVAWEEGKSLKIKEHSGKEMVFEITGKTKLVGKPAVGEVVVVRYSTMEGKHVASHVTVTAKTMSQPAPMHPEGAVAAPAGRATGTRGVNNSSHGMIVGWDESTKMLKLKDQSGKDLEFSVTEKTQVVGKMVPGEMAVVRYAPEGGKNVAVHVAVGAAEQQKKAKTPAPRKTPAPPAPAK